MEKQIEILGYIACPSCGTDHGMRITRDKNGHPFGWCEKNCGQQLRVGPDQRRIRDFFKLYPQLSARAPEPAAATSAEPMPVPQVKVPVAEPKPAVKPAAKPAPKRSAFEEGLSILGAL
jgi:hypothetical protein